MHGEIGVQRGRGFTRVTEKSVKLLVLFGLLPVSTLAGVLCELRGLLVGVLGRGQSLKVKTKMKSSL